MIEFLETQEVSRPSPPCSIILPQANCSLVVGSIDKQVTQVT